MIATFVSSGNDCHFCRDSHRAAAAHHLEGNYALVDAVQLDPQTAPISEKLKALLNIADKVRQGGKQVSGADVERARSEGASDREIHDTVLIAAAFCMFNRYVDGLAAWTPMDPEMYRQRARLTAEHGYTASPPR